MPEDRRPDKSLTKEQIDKVKKQNNIHPIYEGDITLEITKLSEIICKDQPLWYGRNIL